MQRLCGGLAKGTKVEMAAINLENLAAYQQVKDNKMQKRKWVINTRERWSPTLLDRAYAYIYVMMCIDERLCTSGVHVMR